MIVVDASVLTDFILRTGAWAAVARRLLEPGQSIQAPHLIDVEVLSAVRRHATQGLIGDQRGREAIRDYSDLGLVRHPHVSLLPRAWALRQSLSAYDALYVALAEILGAPLLTRDAKLSRSHGHRAKIELLSVGGS